MLPGIAPAPVRSYNTTVTFSSVGYNVYCLTCIVGYLTTLYANPGCNIGKQYFFSRLFSHKPKHDKRVPPTERLQLSDRHCAHTAALPNTPRSGALFYLKRRGSLATASRRNSAEFHIINLSALFTGGAVLLHTSPLHGLPSITRGTPRVREHLIYPLPRRPPHMIMIDHFGLGMRVNKNHHFSQFMHRY